MHTRGGADPIQIARDHLMIAFLSSQSTLKSFSSSTTVRDADMITGRVEDSCSDPQARSNPISGSEPKPGDACLIIFVIFHLFVVFFFKNVATRIPGPTRMEDPNWSPVYSNVFIYLIKTFIYVLLF